MTSRHDAHECSRRVVKGTDAAIGPGRYIIILLFVLFSHEIQPFSA